MKIYHFCALRQASNGNLDYLDGTLKSDITFASVEEYNQLKEDIGKAFVPPALGGIVLLSLTDEKEDMKGAFKNASEALGLKVQRVAAQFHYRPMTITRTAGIPCNHPGCLNHVTHPCEGCGRVAGRPKEFQTLLSDLERILEEK